MIEKERQVSKFSDIFFVPTKNQPKGDLPWNDECGLWLIFTRPSNLQFLTILMATADPPKAKKKNQDHT
jgi:hypothetical protein